MKWLILLGVLLSGCAAKVPEPTNGWIVPESCGDSWLCEDDPKCKEEQYKFLCEKWSKK